MQHEIIWLNRERNVYLERYQLSCDEELSNLSKRPAVIVLPGGGYTFHSEREAEPIALAYMAEGYNAYILHYSVGEHAQWPNPLRDLEETLRMIRAKADEWQTDPQKLCTVGFSAGGHLSLAVSCMGEERPNAEILGYPAATEEIAALLPYPGIPGLIDKVDANTAPTFIFSTMRDELVPIGNSIRLIAALDAAKVESEIHIFRDGCHGQSLSKAHISNGLRRFIHPEIQCWFEMSMNFLRGVFGGFPEENDHPHWKLIGGGLDL